MTLLILVACVLLGVAAIMSGVAWRLAREEEQRSGARIAALAAELGTEPAAFRHPAVRWSAIAMAIVALASVTLVGLVIANRPTGGTSASTTATASKSTAASRSSLANDASSQPLELESLGQVRDGDQLIVRGVVRNPPGSSPVDRVAAVVFVFDGHGEFVASGRAMVDPPRVAPGTESSFLVTVLATDQASRYRVSFRDDDRILTHVDRRARTSTTASTATAAGAP